MTVLEELDMETEAGAMLARIDEKTGHTHEMMTRMVETMREHEEKDDQRFRDVTREYVSQKEFEPVKKVVYGLVGLILTAVAGALVALVLVKK